MVSPNSTGHLGRVSLSSTKYLGIAVWGLGDFGLSIAVRQVTKRFGKFTALKDVSLDVPTGRLVALLGPSGSGKTTLLRIIAGLESADSGSVHYQNEDVTDRSAKDRNVGFVFQHYALFRHMTVFENVAFGMRVRSRPKAEIQSRVQELLGLVRLENLGQRYPAQLSGGQRQRVALARALAVQPRVLLLDEPFGALDAKVRQELRQWLRRLHDELHVTSVFVTHDQEEAFEVADDVVVMREGVIEQAGKAHDVFEQPATQFVMDFLGHVNVFQGRVQSGVAHLQGLRIDYPAYASPESRLATVYIRPHELEIGPHAGADQAMRCRVLHVAPARSVTRVQLLVIETNEPIQVDLTPDRHAELGLKPGAEVYVWPRKIRLFVPGAEDYVI
jgi:sulfate/thiosulfate transport system ATP-binding protein